MKRIAALALIALVAALAVGPAQAFSTNRLTVNEARSAVQKVTEGTIAALLYRGSGKARVRVTGCKVSGHRGRCRVAINGTSRCTYIAHVLSAPNTWVVWGDRLKCS